MHIKQLLLPWTAWCLLLRHKNFKHLLKGDGLECCTLIHQTKYSLTHTEPHSKEASTWMKLKFPSRTLWVLARTKPKYLPNGKLSTLTILFLTYPEMISVPLKTSLADLLSTKKNILDQKIFFSKMPALWDKLYHLTKS